MARPLRIEYEGAIFHVTSRGNERRNIVRDGRDRRRFLDFLGRVTEDRRWRLYAWVLMSNHYHLLLELRETGLSKGIHWLNQRLAQTFNGRHDRVGHLFQGRFKAIHVEREGHFLELLRYIVLNPVRAKMIENVAEYEWSSYAATAGPAPAPGWLDVRGALAQFDSSNVDVARAEYRTFVEAGCDGYRPWDQLNGQIYLGSEQFRDTLQKRIGAKSLAREHPRAQRNPLSPAVDQIASRVADTFSVPLEQLRGRSRRPARKALALLAEEEGGCTQSEIARWMDISRAALWKLRASAAALYETDAAYRLKIDTMRSRKVNN